MKLQLSTMGLTMIATLAFGTLLLPLASAIPGPPDTPCPGPSGGTHSGWVYLGPWNGVPTFRCYLGLSGWLYCQKVGNNADNCWFAWSVADHDIQSIAIRISYPVDLNGPTPIPSGLPLP